MLNTLNIHNNIYLKSKVDQWNFLRTECLGGQFNKHRIWQFSHGPTSYCTIFASAVERIINVQDWLEAPNLAGETNKPGMSLY